MKRVVFYSGGALSWAAAMRTIERHGRENVTLLFTDTSMEDGDLYRFLTDSEAQLGIPVTRVCDGRTPWDVYKHKRIIGNTRMDPCSENLKRKPAHDWLRENAASATLVFGIDFMEMHRLTGLKRRYGEIGYEVEAPMCEAPYMSKADVLSWMRQEGLEPPRLYAMGFSHNNCGGFCCRAGQGHFANLLRELPEVFALHERKEQELRKFLGKDVTVLRDRRGGRTRPMSLRALRGRIQGGKAIADDEIGGCACFVQSDLAAD